MDSDHRRATGVRYVDRVSRETKEVRGRVVVAVRPGARVGEDPAQFQDESAARRARELERDPRTLLDGSPLGSRRRGGEFPDLEDKATLDRARRPNGLYGIRFRNTANGPRSKRFLRGFGYQGGGTHRFQLDRAGIRERVQDVAPRLHRFGSADRLRRVPSLPYELRGARPGDRRRVRHSRAAHSHDAGERTSWR